MSEQSGGPGWWIASDGKWYPPEQAPGAAPAQPQPTAPPSAPPTAPLPTSAPGSSPDNKGKVVAVLVAALVLVAVGVVVALTRDSGGDSSKGNVGDFCSQSKDFREDAVSDRSDVSSDEENQIALERIEALDKVAPPEIKGDVDTLVEGSKLIIAISNGQLDKIKQFDQAKVTKASKNLERFVEEKCGVKLGSDSSS
jgi:hypothetical protein